MFGVGGGSGGCGRGGWVQTDGFQAFVEIREYLCETSETLRSKRLKSSKDKVKKLKKGWGVE